MAYAWPTDPPGKKPSHSIPWATHQANVAATNAANATAQAQQAVQTNHNIALANGAPPKGRMPLPGELGASPSPAAAPAPASSPGAQAGTPATQPAAATITPDATYLAAAAQQAFNRTTKINQLTSEGSDDRTNTTTTINRMIEDAVGNRQKITEGGAKEGLFYSGQLTKRLGEYEKQLGRARDDAQTGFSQRQSARDAAIAAINQGAPIDDAVLMAEAGSRQVDRDSAAASLNSLVPNLASGPNAAPSSTAVQTVKSTTNRGTGGNPRSGQEYTIVPGNGGVWHVYAGGKRVWVPKKK